MKKTLFAQHYYKYHLLPAEMHFSSVPILGLYVASTCISTETRDYKLKELQKTAT